MCCSTNEWIGEKQKRIKKLRSRKRKRHKSRTARHNSVPPILQAAGNSKSYISDRRNNACFLACSDASLVATLPSRGCRQPSLMQTTPDKNRTKETNRGRPRQLLLKTPTTPAAAVLMLLAERGSPRPVTRCGAGSRRAGDAIAMVLGLAT